MSGESMGFASVRSGFTLVELLIVIVVLAVLVGIAIPLYNQQMSKARRSDAVQALLAIQNEQEEFRANCRQYAAALSGARTCNPATSTYVLGLSATSADGYYSLGLSNATSTTYTATATPQGAQAGDSCGTFAINQDGPDYAGAYAGADCWGR